MRPSIAARAAFLALSLAAAPALAQTPAIAWDRGLWDPAGEAAGQLDLPLPCGGGMAFLPVETPVDLDNPLSDRRIQLGGANPETGFLDYFRAEHLRGGFVVDGAAVYYLAKYETTQDQWAAVMGEECPTPGRRGTRPQGGVSWFDGVAFTRRLSEWLRTEAPGALPKAEEAPGYVRLPTEAEWEYAARGGATMDQADFRAALPPMDGTIGDYAWHYGPRSANGSLRPIGIQMRKPNPLGLHGMFGGVEELALEPFRMNRLGREHGQVGGFVTRGGSIDTDAAELRSSLRAEWPFFNVVDGSATAFDTFGLRPAISAPVNVSLARTNRIRDRWMAEADSEPDAEADPVGVLDELAEAQTDVRLRNELGFIRAEILSDRRARDEAAALALRRALMSGAALSNWMRQEVAALEKDRATLGVIDGALGDETTPASIRGRYQQMKPALEARIAQAEENVSLSESAYLANLYDMIERHSAEEVETQADVLIDELDQRGQASLAPAVDRFERVIAFVRADPGAARDEITPRILE